MALAVPVVLESGERVVLGDTGDYGLGVTVGEAFRKTRTREGEALKDHVGDGATLQLGRARLAKSVHELQLILDDSGEAAIDLKSTRESCQSFGS